MFVYSVKASSLRFFSILFLSVALLTALIILVPSYEPLAAEVSDAAVTVNFDKVKTNEDRISFLSQFGWTVDPKPYESEEVTIPSDFDGVFTEYNDIQKSQGLDLSKYKRRDVMRYTYIVENYPEYEGRVYANVLVYKNRVIGGDICSAAANGFVRTFDNK